VIHSLGIFSVGEFIGLWAFCYLLWAFHFVGISFYKLLSFRFIKNYCHSFCKLLSFRCKFLAIRFGAFRLLLVWASITVCIFITGAFLFRCVFVLSEGASMYYSVVCLFQRGHLFQWAFLFQCAFLFQSGQPSIIVRVL
jgi:hypothetical protein